MTAPSSFTSPSTIESYLLSRGLTRERIIEMSHRELEEFVIREQRKDEARVLARRSRNDGQQLPWREEARARGIRIRDEVLTIVREELAQLPDLPTEFIRSQFEGASDDTPAETSSAKRMRELIDDVADDAYWACLKRALTELKSEEWVTAEILDGLREAGIKAADTAGITPDWDAVYTVPLEDILAGKTLGAFGAEEYHSAFDAPFSIAYLPGLDEEARESQWLNWISAQVLCLYMDEAADSWSKIPGLVVQELNRVLHPAARVDERITRHREGRVSFGSDWRTLFEAGAYFFGHGENELRAGIRISAQQLVDGQLGQGWLGRRLVWPLDMPVFTAGREFALRDTLENIFITGAIGSGKTSGPMSIVGRSILRIGCGALFLCCKMDASEDYREWAKQSGRSKDVVHITTKNVSEFCYNPLDWELAQTDLTQELPANIIENIVRIICALIEITGGQTEDLGENQVFVDGMKTILRPSLMLLALAGQKISFDGLLRIIEALPATDAKALTEGELQKLQKSYIGELIEKAKKRNAADLDGLRSIDECWRYFSSKWPKTPARTRESCMMNMEPIIQQFQLYPLLRKGLCGESTITPDVVLDGKIIILDISPDKNREMALYFAAIWKLGVQQAVLRRSLLRPYTSADDMRPVGIIADEYQTFFTDWDSAWHLIARSFRGFGLYATQNIEALNVRVKGNANDQRVEQLLGNMATYVWCRNNSAGTNEWASKTIGEHKEILYSHGTQTQTSRPASIALSLLTGGAQGGLQALNAQMSRSDSSGTSEQWRRIFPPELFSGLASGGPEHGFIVEALVFHKRQGTDGKPYFRVNFPQPPYFERQAAVEQSQQSSPLQSSVKNLDARPRQKGLRGILKSLFTAEGSPPVSSGRGIMDT